MTGCQHHQHDSIQEHITCEVQHNPFYQQILFAAGTTVLTALCSSVAYFSSKTHNLSLSQKFTAGTALTASVAGIYWYYSAKQEDLEQPSQHKHDASCNHAEINEHHNADRHFQPTEHSELNEVHGDHTELDL